MTTMLAVYLRPGRCVGVCDARCYNALQPSRLREPRRNACKCICGGANHGMGEARAIQNTLDRSIGQRHSDIEAFAQSRGFAIDGLLVIDRLRASEFVARKRAKAHFKPVPIAPDDLFYCEGLASAPISEAPGPALGSGEEPLQTASSPGDPVR